MSLQPLVSVIMPVYNGEKYLSQAIESILNQTFSNLELIIVDDGSSDGSVAIVEKYQQQDKRVILIRQENRGVSSARNKALKFVQGEWVYFIDCDDVYFPNYIERMMEVSNLTGADYICCNFDMGYCLNLTTYMPCKNEEIVVFEHDSISAFDYLCAQGVGTSLSIKHISTHLIKKFDISFDTTMTYGEDLFFCWKACLVSKKVAYLPEKLYFYRQTVNSAVSKVHPKLFEKYNCAFEDMEQFAISNNLMCNELKKSMEVSLIQRLPALVRMTAHENRGIYGAYKRLNEIIESKQVQEVLIRYDTNTDIECLLTKSAKKLFLQAKKKKILIMLIYAYYSNLRMQIARKMKGGKK